MNKNAFHIVSTVVFLSLSAFHFALAEPEKVDAVVDLLHQAETSASPVPLLEKAKDVLKKFNPKPNQDEMIERRVGPRKRAAVNTGAHKYKEEAMEALDKAVAAAKAAAAAVPAGGVGAPPALGTAMDRPGTDLKAKIENAIAKVHQAGELKN